jgi:hypothetical protein
MTGVDDNVGRSSGSISLMSIKYQSESYGTGKEDTNDHVSKKSVSGKKDRGSTVSAFFPQSFLFVALLLYLKLLFALYPVWTNT